MTKQASKPSDGNGVSISLITCFILFACYFINVILGKLKILYGLNLPHLGNVAEFLLLFGACIFLIIAALKRETAEKTI